MTVSYITSSINSGGSCRCSTPETSILPAGPPTALASCMAAALSRRPTAARRARTRFWEGERRKISVIHLKSATSSAAPARIRIGTITGPPLWMCCRAFPGWPRSCGRCRRRVKWKTTLRIADDLGGRLGVLGRCERNYRRLPAIKPLFRRTDIFAVRRLKQCYGTDQNKGAVLDQTVGIHGRAVKTRSPSASKSRSTEEVSSPVCD